MEVVEDLAMLILKCYVFYLDAFIYIFNLIFSNNKDYALFFAYLAHLLVIRLFVLGRAWRQSPLKVLMNWTIYPEIIGFTIFFIMAVQYDGTNLYNEDGTLDQQIAIFLVMLFLLSLSFLFKYVNRINTIKLGTRRDG